VRSAHPPTPHQRADHHAQRQQGLIGLEVVTIPWDPRLIAPGLAAVPLVLLALGIAVVAPLAVLRPILSLGRLAPLTLI